MIATSARPQLARKARLRFDRHGGRHMLVYPERALLLNESAARIAQLCTGEYTVGAIVEQLAAQSGDVAREAVERDVRAFLEQLLARALITLDGVS